MWFNIELTDLFVVIAVSCRQVSHSALLLKCHDAGSLQTAHTLTIYITIFFILFCKIWHLNILVKTRLKYEYVLKIDADDVLVKLASG